jgi:hypothetical protein
VISLIYTIYSSLLRSSSTTNFPWLSPADNLSGTAVSYFELNWERTPTELRTGTGFIWNSLYNRPHRKHLTRMLLLKRVHQSFHSNGRSADNSEPTIASLHSNEQKTLVLLLLRAFRGVYGCNNYCMGETRHNMNETAVIC